MLGADEAMPQAYRFAAATGDDLLDLWGKSAVIIHILVSLYCSGIMLNNNNILLLENKVCSVEVSFCHFFFREIDSLT